MKPIAVISAVLAGIAAMLAIEIIFVAIVKVLWGAQ